VFKILKPGIEERLEQELELFENVGAHLDEKCNDFQLPHLDYRESFEQVRDKLRHETRLDLEQGYLGQARAFFMRDPRIQVPALLEPCTPRVTAMERVTGRKVTDQGLDSKCEKRRLAKLVVEAMLARPIFTKGDPALFHGDPHAGNLFLTSDNRLAILDWSLVGSLGERERTAMVQIILAALSLDHEGIVTELEGLTDRQRPDRPTLISVVRAWVRRIWQGQFPGFTWLIGLLDEAVQTAQLRVGADLLLFRKTLYTLEGVVADIERRQHLIDEVLTDEFLTHFAVEWPQRWFAQPDCRRFATRISNADLLQVMLRWPSTVARFWMEQANDWRAGFQSVRRNQTD
jgi:ubiquinone biosynthesis protein